MEIEESEYELLKQKADKWDKYGGWDGNMALVPTWFADLKRKASLLDQVKIIALEDEYEEIQMPRIQELVKDN